MNRRLHDAVAELDAHRSKQAEETPNLFSVQAELESVADNAGPVWRDEALDLLHVIASTKTTFTVEDLDRYLPPTIDKRAVGWVLRQGARNGWMAADGYRTSGPSRHGRPVVVWRSLIAGNR